MMRFAARQRLRHQPSRRIEQPCRYLVNRLHFALELEPVIRDATTQRERRAFRIGVENQLRFAFAGVTPDQRHRDLRAFDRRARDTELVGEVADVARHRPPASAHARLRHARVLPVRGFLVDHQRERHILREEFLEFSKLALARVRQAVG